MWAGLRRYQQQCTELYHNGESRARPLERKSRLEGVVTIKSFSAGSRRARDPTGSTSSLGSYQMLGGSRSSLNPLAAPEGELTVLNRYTEKVERRYHETHIPPPEPVVTKKNLMHSSNVQSAFSLKAASELDELYRETIDAFFRKRISEKRQETTLPAYKAPKLSTHDTPLTADMKLKVIQIDKERERLRQRELELLVKKWQDEWKRRRPPHPNWHELATSDFTVEAEKSRFYEADPEGFHDADLEFRRKLFAIRWQALILELLRQ